MEDDLIQSKENKVQTNAPEEVAGREGKGTLASGDKLAGTSVTQKVKEGFEKITPHAGKKG